MRLIATLTTLLIVCLPYADFREYHYNRPQVPFLNGNVAQPRVLQQPHVQPLGAGHYSPRTILVNHYGLAGTAHINRQLPTVYGSNVYSPTHGSVSTPQYQTSGQSQLSYNQRGTAGGFAGNNYASSIAASYYPRAQQQYSSNVNPLTHYQQQNAYGNQPQSQQQYAQNYANGQQQFGHGSQGGGHAQTLSLDGRYVSQSESGQLHSYQHQQHPIGDTRPFSRQVTNCGPNGQCERNTFGPGQFDQQHQNNAAVARATTVNVSEKCRRIAAEKAAALAANQLGGGSSYADATYNVGTSNDGSYTASSGGYSAGHEIHSNSIENINLVRPKNRRHYEYTEVVLPNDPYN